MMRNLTRLSVLQLRHGKLGFTKATPDKKNLIILRRFEDLFTYADYGV